MDSVVPQKMKVVPSAEVYDLLRKAFDQVCNPADWKAPVDCAVEISVSGFYQDAIRFMTGTECHCNVIEHDGKRLMRLKSMGYRNGPAGG